jgi:hypothetical protein
MMQMGQEQEQDEDEDEDLDESLYLLEQNIGKGTHEDTDEKGTVTEIVASQHLPNEMHRAVFRCESQVMRALMCAHCCLV